jgi:multidrug resistance efflux pump
MAQYQKQVGDALATQDRAALAIAQAKLDQAQAQADLAAENLARATIRAPFDGIVLEGDLSQSLGAPLKRGDTLMTVAPRQRFRVIVEVGERDIARARIGAPGTLTLASQPGAPLDFVVSRISPVAIARDGRNFFEVEGRLDQVPPLLNPGLKGVARIAAGPEPLGWIWTHRLIDWLRYHWV